MKITHTECRQKSRLTVLFLGISLMMSLPVVSHGQNQTESSQENQRPERARESRSVPVKTYIKKEVDYGETLLIVDGLSVGSILLGATTSDVPTAVIGLYGYALGAPITHLVHGNGSVALGSLGMRVFLPLLGTGLGNAVGDSEGALLGALGGVAGAIVIDRKYLARKTTYVEQKPSLIQCGRLGAQPLLNVDRNGHMTVGLAGHF